MDGEAERKSLGAQPVSESEAPVTPQHRRRCTTHFSLNQATWRSEVVEVEKDKEGQVPGLSFVAMHLFYA